VLRISNLMLACTVTPMMRINISAAPSSVVASLRDNMFDLPSLKAYVPQLLSRKVPLASSTSASLAERLMACIGLLA